MYPVIYPVLMDKFPKTSHLREQNFLVFSYQAQKCFKEITMIMHYCSEHLYTFWHLLIKFVQIGEVYPEEGAE